MKIKASLRDERAVSSHCARTRRRSAPPSRLGAGRSAASSNAPAASPAVSPGAIRSRVAKRAGECACIGNGHSTRVNIMHYARNPGGVDM